MIKTYTAAEMKTYSKLREMAYVMEQIKEAADRGEFDTRIALGGRREKKIKILKDLGYEVTPTDHGDPYIVSWK